MNDRRGLKESRLGGGFRSEDGFALRFHAFVARVLFGRRSGFFESRCLMAP